MWATIIIGNVKCPNEHSFLPQLHTCVFPRLLAWPTLCEPVGEGCGGRPRRLSPGQGPRPTEGSVSGWALPSRGSWPTAQRSAQLTATPAATQQRGSSVWCSLLSAGGAAWSELEKTLQDSLCQDLYRDPLGPCFLNCGSWTCTAGRCWETW